MFASKKFSERKHKKQNMQKRMLGLKNCELPKELLNIVK